MVNTFLKGISPEVNDSSSNLLTTMSQSNILATILQGLLPNDAVNDYRILIGSHLVDDIFSRPVIFKLSFICHYKHSLFGQQFMTLKDSSKHSENTSLMIEDTFNLKRSASHRKTMKIISWLNNRYGFIKILSENAGNFYITLINIHLCGCKKEFGLTV